MSKTKKYPLPVTGIDSLSNETALGEGAVRTAVNVDIGRAGRFKRRTGQTLVEPGADFHSLWVSQQRGSLFLAKGKVLGTLHEDLSYSALSTLNSTHPLNYTEYNGNIYWTSPDTFQWLPSDSSTARPVGVETPPPAYLSEGPGPLRPGRYGVCMAFVDDRGELGGASPLQTILLKNGGGIRFSGLPIRNGWSLNIYVTETDGEYLRLASSPPAVFPNYLMAEVPAGEACETQYLVPMPPGNFVTWLGGRLYTARGDTLYFSEPLRPHLHAPARGYIPFSGRISFIEAVMDGLYVGDARGVWFLRGVDPVQFDQTLVSTCRAVFNSSIKIPPEHLPEQAVESPNPVALWLSTSGYVVGMESGKTVELQPERVKVPPGLSGRTTYLFRDGIKQVVTPVNSTSTTAHGIAVDSNIP